MYSLILIRYRAPLDVIEAHTEAHRGWLRELKARGTLLASGPFVPRTGGALLVRVPDEGAAAALDAVRDGDPFFRLGLANYELLAWNPVLGREGLDTL
ncbi:MAG: hypothetical protein FJ363_03800 [Gemmatimonadetes bacterium]|nr:hypothetical protein [Gemmatimonadota bacterium]